MPHTSLIVSLPQEDMRRRLLSALRQKYTIVCVIRGEELHAYTTDARNIDVLRAFCDGWKAGAGA